MAENMQPIWMEQPYTEEKTDPPVKCRKMVHVKGMLLCHNHNEKCNSSGRKKCNNMFILQTDLQLVYRRT
jgi:hypothetical protein